MFCLFIFICLVKVFKYGDVYKLILYLYFFSILEIKEYIEFFLLVLVICIIFKVFCGFFNNFNNFLIFFNFNFILNLLVCDMYFNVFLYFII